MPYRASVLATSLLESLESRRLFAAGNLDTTFGGGDGKTPVASTGTVAEVRSVLRQADGKLVIVGDRLPSGAMGGQNKLNVVRLEADGDLDSTFGGDGIIETDITESAVLDVAIDPATGRIAIATDVGLKVFDANGDPVATYGAVNGALRVVFQADGKLIVASQVTIPDPVFGVDKAAIEVRRFKTDGTLEDAFGDAGVRQFALSTDTTGPWRDSGASYSLRQIVVATDGAIYVAARRDSYYFVDNGTDLYGRGLSVFRLTESGEMDEAFNPGGEAGIHTETNAGDVQLMAMKAIAGGGMVVVWSVGSTNFLLLDRTYFVQTLDATGAIDATVGSTDFNGQLHLPAGIRNGISFDIGIDPQGRLVASGLYRPGGNGDSPSLFATRFMPGGGMDFSYDDDGIYTTAPGALGDWAADSVVLPDGSVVLAAAKHPSDGVGYVVTKLQGGDGTPTPAPAVTLNSKGTLVVTTADTAENVSLSIRKKDGRLVFRVGTFAQSFAPSKVKRIAIYTVGGDDVVTIGPGVRGSYVDAGDGSDILNGGQGGDVLLGGLGGDLIYGNDGDDTLLGNGGNDYLLGGAGKDDLFGNGGTDTLNGAGGNDRLFGGPDEADRIYGGAGTDAAAEDEKDSYDSIEMLLA